MKQVSHPPFLGIVDDKKWCPFFYSRDQRPIFLHPKSPKIKKLTPFFVVNYTQKWWMGHLFHMNITIGWVLGKFWKLPILGSFLADFPLWNPKIKTLCRYPSIFEINSDFWCMVSLHTEKARFRWPGHKNEFCFFRNTLPRILFVSSWFEIYLRLNFFFQNSFWPLTINKCEGSSSPLKATLSR